jgi:hypothetical protein
LKQKNTYFKNRSSESKEIFSDSSFDFQAGQVVQPTSTLDNFIRKNGVYIAMASTFIGLFAGIPLLIWFWDNTVINVGVVFLLLFVCGSLGLIQWKYVKNHLDMQYHQFSMYAFSGFGMCLINFIFSLNSLLYINGETKIYSVESIFVNTAGLEIVLSGDGHTAPFERDVTNFIKENYDEIYGIKKIVVTVNTGLFGFKRVTGCAIIQNDSGH